MHGSTAIERVVWGIVAVLLAIAAVNLQSARRAEPQLGVWDADLAGRFQMPAPIALDPDLASELLRDKPLVLVPGAGEATACRELFKYYGLEADRLERATRSGNPQGPCGVGQAISIPLDNDR
jgi:hypothetical protein